MSLWGGRFTGKTDPLMEAFNASFSFDQRLCKADIRGSQTYAKALSRTGLISSEECDKLVSGLEQVLQEWASNTFKSQPSDEDIHTANERRLGEIIGTKLAGKLHTGRSRNDQVATDMRIWVRDESANILEYLRALISVAVHRAQQEIDVIMPGYTHLQRAQPIRWSHWLLSYAWSWKADYDRLVSIVERNNQLPLGSGALAGHVFGIDRDFLAKELGFTTVITNSLYGVSDRDFIAEWLFWSSLTMIHLSRWAEDLILYSTSEFGFVHLADAYSTGSSLMPHKKNPDSLELIRGKSGRVYGDMAGFLVTLKGLPSTYNKDLQEDKEPLFDAIDTISGCLQISAGVLSTMSIHPDKMKANLSMDMLATDVAEYLVRKGVPFRETHHIAGQAVRLAEERKCGINQLSVPDYKSLHPAFDEDVAGVFDYEQSVENRNVAGGTSRRAVLAQIEQLKEWSNVNRPNVTCGQRSGGHKMPYNIAFVHPDLGIGGAERLVVDAALGLQSKGHQVTFYTSHHDLNHCFEETRNGTLKVRVYGDFLPRSIIKMGHILFAMMRSTYLAIMMITTQPAYDLMIVDQLSVSIPIFRLSNAKILFYCHFPDKLLTARESILKKLYRIPVDYAEELTTKMADEIVVNSAFTSTIFESSFRRIRKRPQVLHPGLQISAYIGQNTNDPLSDDSIRAMLSNKTTFVSINRFERKKNLALAIESFATIVKGYDKSDKLRLVMAGGYDPRVTENVEYLAELAALCAALSLTHHTIFPMQPSKAIPQSTQILFLPSFTNAQRTYLLSTSIALLYTPKNEHFGIVPLEAMISSCIVIASNSGGPKETVVNNVTGYLVDDTIDGFGGAMLKVLNDLREEKRKDMGRLGRERVHEFFSLDRFTMQLEIVIQSIMEGKCEREGVETFRRFRYVLSSILVGLLGAGYVVMIHGGATVMLMGALGCIVGLLMWINNV
ncbi:argininosuccinate lyase [Synchytrium endobioticum]|uniref:Argininosuccinate lyase n=1 Tax=Synchytrium endobioticum TaxID=286115 RepID=A0A507CI82_9FUNG|nr:argininosuccinate lyase [Synchytrium endobioticum]